MKRFIIIIKYIFFPFLMANAGGVDFHQAIGANQKVTAMVETANTVWIGTGEGLWKINKNNGNVFHLTAQNSVLPSNHVNDICQTPDGNIYAATDKGIFRFDGYAYLVINTENSQLPDAAITALACDEDGNLWVGTTGHGLVLMHNNNKCRFFGVNNSVLTSNSIESITRDNTGTIYAELTNHDLVKISGGEMKLIAEPKPQEQNNTIVTNN